jgi:hypothetical protein
VRFGRSAEEIENEGVVGAKFVEITEAWCKAKPTTMP